MQVWIGCPQFHEIGAWMTHRLMHELLGKHAKNAKMQRRPNGWHKASKPTITSHRMEKGYALRADITGICSHKQSHPNKPQEGQMQPHKQVAPKTNKHKPTKGKKHGKAQIQIGKHEYKAQKQASIHMHKGNDPNPMIQA